MPQGHCYICLAIEGGISVGSLRMKSLGPPPQEAWRVPARLTLRSETLLRFFGLLCAGHKISGLQKGPAERGHVKERQKSSKSVKKLFDTFRQFSRRAKKRQKCFSTLFDNFRAAPFFRPLWGGALTKFPHPDSLPPKEQEKNHQGASSAGRARTTSRRS